MLKPNDSSLGPFLLAANALVLNRAHFLIDQHERLSREARDGSRWLDQRDYQSFRLFLDAVSLPGLLHDVIDPPFQNFASLPWRDESLKRLLLSDADVARLSLGEVPFSAEERASIERGNGGQLSPLEWLMPICRWLPGDVIWTAREIVGARLQDMAAADRGESPAATARGGPRSGKDISAENKAVDALEAVVRSAAGRLPKSDVVDVIEEFVGSKRAAERVWSRARLGKWGMAGRIPAARQLSPDDFRQAFSSEIRK